MTEPKAKRTATEDTARTILDEYATVGRGLVAAWQEATQTGLKQAFALQNEAIATSFAFSERVMAAGRTLTEKGAAVMRESQTAATTLTALNRKVADETLETARA